jgi:hypothetical protein
MAKSMSWQRQIWFGLVVVIYTADIHCFSNIFANTMPYAKRLLPVSLELRWVSLMKKNREPKISLIVNSQSETVKRCRFVHSPLCSALQVLKIFLDRSKKFNTVFFFNLYSLFI